MGSSEGRAIDSMSGTNSSSWDAEEANHQQQQQQQQRNTFSLENVVDDFSLQSQGIRFRANGREMKIYNTPQGQLILEKRTDTTASPNDDDDDGELEEQAPTQDTKWNGILVKTTHDKSYALSFLRAAYSMMAIFVAGFLFILGTVILLFLFIDMAIKLGVVTDEPEKPVEFIFVVLSVPVFIYSLAMGMTLVVRFVIDTFNGHPFLQSFGMGVVMTDWLAFVMYLGIPILAFIVTLLAQRDDFWEVSLTTWFASILIFWCFFSACEFWLEIWACLELMEEDDGSSLIDGDPWNARVVYWLKKAKDGCARTMRYRMSGKHTVFFKQMNEGNATTILNDKCTNCIDYIGGDLVAESPYSFIAKKEWNPCFDQKPPEQVHTLDETLGNTYYVTRDSWSLEKLFCRRGGLSSTIPITQGESSITEAQINSNIACNLLGNIIIMLLFVGVVLWFARRPTVFAILSVILLIAFILVGFATRRLVRLRNDIVNKGGTRYRYSEIYQQSVPKDRVIWVFFFLEVIFLYVLPLVFLAVQNLPAAAVFAVIGLFSSLRHYLNPRILLLESEKKNYFRNTFAVKAKKDKKEWNKKSRMYHIVAVGGDTARRFWLGTYLIFVIFFMTVALVALNEDEGYTIQNDPNIVPSTAMTLVQGYNYKSHPHLPYPTCRLQDGFGGHDFELADFSFLSGLAYRTDTEATNGLNMWFGEGIAKNSVELVEEFKNWPGYINYEFGSSVSYKLITFSDSDTSAVLTIRGTATTWDLIADAQLWLPAMLFQGLRFLLPGSEMFTPILHRMVDIVTQLETTSITKVSYYRETTQFVNYLKEVRGFDQLSVTGHSLGGGLAIITGAQTNTNVVAISGPNAMLSRDSFKPPITVDNLNTFTFNVVPARDPIPMIDDKAMLYQNINCTAPANNFFGCHHSARTLCEIQYTCGSVGHPVLCECVLDYDYPEPLPEATNETTSSTSQQQKTFLEKCVDICIEETEATGPKDNCQRWKEKAEAAIDKKKGRQAQLMALATE